MDHKIDINTLALDSLRQCKEDIARHAARIIDSLAINPYPSRAQCLGEPDNIWRMHEDQCRIVYTVKGEKVMILAVHPADRKEFYKKLKKLLVKK